MREGNLTAALGQTTAGHKANKAASVYWDLTDTDGTNDPAKKAGVGDVTKALAFLETDKATLRSVPITGSGQTTLSSVWPHEPDMKVLRLHSPFGKGDKTSAWADRIIAEHDNPSNQRKHKSSMVIDQRQKQLWAWVMDQWWVKLISGGTKNDHEELSFGGDGFLNLLKNKKGGFTASGVKNVRAALMLALNRNLGPCTDGILGAQLWQVLHLYKVGSSTVSDPLPESIEMTQLMLRGDVRYQFGDRAASLAMHKGALPMTFGKTLTGYHWLNVAFEWPPSSEHYVDPKSNHPVYPRPEKEGVWVFVEEPVEWDFPRPPVATPATYPGRPAGFTAAPAANSQAGYVGDLFTKAGLEGYTTTIDVPEDLVGGWGLNVAVDFMVPAAGWGGNGAEFQFDALVTALGAAPAGAVTQSTQTTVNATSYGTNGAVARVMFFVTPENLAGKRGGKISATLYRRTDRDTFAGDVLVLGMFTAFAPQITRIA